MEDEKVAETAGVKIETGDQISPGEEISSKTKENLIEKAAEEEISQVNEVKTSEIVVKESDRKSGLIDVSQEESNNASSNNKKKTKKSKPKVIEDEELLIGDVKKEEEFEEINDDYVSSNKTGIHFSFVNDNTIMAEIVPPKTKIDCVAEIFKNADGVIGKESHNWILPYENYEKVLRQLTEHAEEIPGRVLSRDERCC